MPSSSRRKVMAKTNKEHGGEPSVVEDQGLYASSCGYCKSETKTSISYGLWAHSLSVYDYQDLLNRGWRRSGMFLYKPEMSKTCCPAYTIRLKAESFHPTKEQNRVMHRMQRYLDGTYDGPAAASKEDLDVPGKQISSGLEANDTFMLDRTENSHYDMDCHGMSERKHVDVEYISKDLADTVRNAITACSVSHSFPADIEVPKVVLQKVKPTARKRIKTSTGEPVYTCNIAFSFSAALTKHKDCHQILEALHHCDHGGTERKCVDSRKVSPAVLAELIAAKLKDEDTTHGFLVEACNGHLNFVLQKAVSTDTRKREETHFHKSVAADSEACTRKSVQDVRVSTHRKRKRVLEVRMRRSAFDPEEFALYKRYQIAVHRDKPDDVKESSYVRFLVNTPLMFVPPSKAGTTFCGFGSFHQQYLIDGRLVAVGVVDILPSCLSSKYLFWDPDLPFLSLGKYSAMQEIQWVQNAGTVCPSLEYYYLGYYIHTCPKMRYKVAYRPSELLCPVRFQWVPFDIAQPFLDIQPYVCLSDCSDAAGKQRSGKLVIQNTRCLVIPEDDDDAEDEDDDGGNDIIDMDDNLKLDASLMSGATASSSKESEDVSNILLKLGNQFLQFKHLQAGTVVPQKFIDALVYDLRKYSHVVGPVLATKMAYVLG